MKVVLDTNVLVSGLLKPYQAPGEIVRMASSGILSLCYDARILAEYGEVLIRPKFEFQPSQVKDLLDQFKADGTLVTAIPIKERLPDPHDEMFLEVALAGRVRCLITGNLKDYPSSKRQGMTVVSPSEMLGIYRRVNE